MIVLKSIIDGMTVINGGFIMNLVLAVTMACLLMGRLPDYGVDTERTSEAQFIFWGLFVYHLSYSVIRYLSTILTSKLKIYQAIYLFSGVWLFAVVGQKWVFRPGRNWEAMDDKQRMFEKWMDIEILIVYSSVISSIIFVFVRGFKNTPLIIAPLILS